MVLQQSATVMFGANLMFFDVDNAGTVIFTERDIAVSKDDGI
jgi:hypothetical protein